MPITIQNDKLFTLQTENSTYQMKVEEHGFLLHCYYGTKIEDQDLSYRVQQQDRGFAANPPDANGDRTLSVDTMPQEYSTFGVGDFRESCLDVRNPYGGIACDLRYVGYHFNKGKCPLAGLPATYGTEQEAECLEIQLKDSATNILVVLQYAVFSDFDVITRSVKIQNQGTETVVLKRILSLCIDDSIPADRDFVTFYGRHMGENNMQRTPLCHGKQSVGSLRGASSPHYSPFVMICNRDANEENGDVYAFSFVYSGNYLAQIETDQISQSRFVMGIHPQNFSWNLNPNDEFQAPEVICAYSATGFDNLSGRLHQFQRNHLMRGPYKYNRCPILVNNWEATYFDFDKYKLLELADAAKECGIEMLVLDDGWFGSRNDDTTSLGDWFANTKKLDGGLDSLSKAVHEKGLKFGLWFEPEMISPQSILMTNHSEWCIGIRGRENVTSRSQCVLDMGNPDVREYLFKRMEEIISEASIDYIKWDMNRSITNAESVLLPPLQQGEIWHRYILGVYELLERLVKRFPDLLIESCASGGGRFDAGMLYYSSQIWGSDNTDAIDRLKIQYGSSFGFPVKCIGSHVSVCPNHQTGRTTPLETRATVAMSGSFGYEMDITKCSDEEKNKIRRLNSKFRKYQKIVQFGNYHRLTNAQSDKWYTAWCVVDESQEEALLSVVFLAPIANAPILCIKLRGLDPNVVYQDEGGKAYTGNSLMKAGYVIDPWRGEYMSKQILFRKMRKIAPSEK